MSLAGTIRTRTLGWLGPILLAISSPSLAAGLPVDPSFAADPVWDDGLAEVSVYDAERVIYGKPRPYVDRLIVVKEEFSDELHVKAEPPYEGRSLTTVLKLNIVSTIPTDNYTYNFLASIFVERRDLTRLVKAAIGSQEWCGTTFKLVSVGAGGSRLHYHSYFDGEGDAEEALPLGEEGLLQEQLLLLVRGAALPQGERVPLRVADPLVTNRARPVSVHDATLESGGVESVRIATGQVRARRFDLLLDSGEWIAYWVEEAPHRALVRMEGSDGRKMILRERGRRDYWSR